MKLSKNVLILVVAGSANLAVAEDLPSWNDTAPKQAIAKFVADVTTEGSPHFVPPSEAYDRESHIGRLSQGLDEAKANGWTVVSMKADWKIIYPTRP